MVVPVTSAVAFLSLNPKTPNLNPNPKTPNLNPKPQNPKTPNLSPKPHSVPGTGPLLRLLLSTSLVLGPSALRPCTRVALKFRDQA